MTTFENLYELARKLTTPEEANQRRVEWCDDRRSLALARQQGGAFEVFVLGPQLRPQLPLVDRHLKHDSWRLRDGSQFEANRIVLPAEDHYLPVAAFLAEELLRNGIAFSTQVAFALTEPLIEMALRRTALDDETLLGLLGELRFLELLLAASHSTKQKANCLEAWEGYQHASRDFSFSQNRQGEVKITRGTHSIHHINSISQVDPRRTASGEPIEQLYLVSMGVAAPASVDEREQALTLPIQIDTILSLLGPKLEAGSRNEIQELFLARVSKYGAGPHRGYDHDEMQGWAAYQTHWRHRFARTYYMNDDEVEVLRLAEVERQRFVSAESVRFTVALPERLGSGTNPHTDLAAFAAELVR